MSRIICLIRFRKLLLGLTQTAIQIERKCRIFMENQDLEPRMFLTDVEDLLAQLALANSDVIKPGVPDVTNVLMTHRYHSSEQIKGLVKLCSNALDACYSCLTILLSRNHKLTEICKFGAFLKSKYVEIAELDWHLNLNVFVTKRKFLRSLTEAVIDVDVKILSETFHQILSQKLDPTGNEPKIISDSDPTSDYHSQVNSSSTSNQIQEQKTSTDAASQKCLRLFSGHLENRIILVTYLVKYLSQHKSSDERKESLLLKFYLENFYEKFYSTLEGLREIDIATSKSTQQSDTEFQLFWVLMKRRKIFFDFMNLRKG